jgi:hypothetical protein
MPLSDSSAERRTSGLIWRAEDRQSTWLQRCDRRLYREQASVEPLLLVENFIPGCQGKPVISDTIYFMPSALFPDQNAAARWMTCRVVSPLPEQLRPLAAKNWAPHLLKSAGTDVAKIRSSAFADAIRAGDKTIEELVRSRVRIVGIVLSNIVDFLSPQMIVLGGGLTDAMPKIVSERVTAGIRAHGSPAASGNLKVVTARHRSHAVTIGAAKFALDSKNQVSERFSERKRARLRINSLGHFVVSTAVGG